MEPEDVPAPLYGVVLQMHEHARERSGSRLMTRARVRRLGLVATETCPQSQLGYKKGRPHAYHGLTRTMDGAGAGLGNAAPDARDSQTASTALEGFTT